MASGTLVVVFGENIEMMIKNKLYNGTVTLNFDGFRHKYMWVEKNKEIKSVTTILKVINKPALINWASGCAVDYISGQIEPGKSYDELELSAMYSGARKAHWQKKEDAGDLGTFLHKWVEKYIKGENPGTPVNPELQESVLKFLIWVKKHNVKFLQAEQVIFSKKYEYSGTTDFICTIDGKMYIGDLKTSNGIYPEMFIQTSAYRYARNEEFPEEKYSGQLIVRIGKDGTFEFAVVKDDAMYKKMFEAFIAAFVLSNNLEMLEKFKAEKE